MGLHLVEVPDWVHLWWGVSFAVLASFFAALALGAAWYHAVLQPARGGGRGTDVSTYGVDVAWSSDGRHVVGIGHGLRARLVGIALLAASFAYPVAILRAAAAVPPVSPISGLVAFLFGSVSVLKSLEVLLGTVTPGAASHGRLLWLVYFVSPVDPQLRNGGPVLVATPPGWRWLNRASLAYGRDALLSGVGLCCLLTYGQTYGFPPAAEGAFAGNMLYVGVTWSVVIAHAMAMAQCVVADFGFAPGPAFRQPYVFASSPQDFWGRRLDLAFQRLLKRTFFYPVRARVSGAVGAGLAALTTFTASGIVHEALWLCMRLGLAAGADARLAAGGARVDASRCTADGLTTAFFVLQGVLCAAGTLLAALLPLALTRRVPGVVKLYVALVFGPLVRLPWYLGRLEACGYWAGMSELYPSAALGPGARAALDFVLPPTLPLPWILGGGVSRELAVHCAVVAAAHALWPQAAGGKAAGGKAAGGKAAGDVENGSLSPG